MRNHCTISILFILMISCTKQMEDTTFLRFYFDGKEQRFENVETKTYLNCGVREWQVSVLDGERFFKINWNNLGMRRFWYTYHGKSIAYKEDVFHLTPLYSGDDVTAIFEGGIVRNGKLRLKFIEQ